MRESQRRDMLGFRKTQRSSTSRRAWLICNVGRKMSKPALKLMTDYQCWPLWHYGGAQIGNVHPAVVGVSDVLAAELVRWAATYDSHLDLGDPAATCWTEEEERQFDLEGRRLCRLLEAEIGDRFRIVYSTKCIPVEEL